MTHALTLATRNSEDGALYAAAAAAREPAPASSAPLPGAQRRPLQPTPPSR